MIVWSGKGFLSVLVLLASIVLLAFVLPKEQGDIGFIISFFVAGLFSWFMGKKLNDQEGRTVIDKETGQEMILKQDHSLFWIKMQYWGPIFVVLGLIILAQQFM